MSLFRSERMLYYEFRMPRENAWEILNEVGELSCVQFIDQNADKASFSRPFSNYIERCRKVEEKLQRIQEQMVRFQKPIHKCPDTNEYLKNLKSFLQIRNKSDSSYFDEIEQEINDHEEKIMIQIQNYEQLRTQYHYFENYQQVLETFSPMLEKYDAQDISQPQDEELGNINNALSEMQNLSGAKLSYLSGVIKQTDKDRFQRFVFRITKGNSYINMQNVISEDENQLYPPTEQLSENERAVFLVVYQGGQNDYLRNKLNKLCESFGVTKYQIPKQGQMFDMLLEIKMKIRDIKLTIIETKSRIQNNLLEKFSQTRFEKNQCSLIEELKLLLAKEKAIYTNMNLLNQNNNVFYGYAWVPAELENKVKNCVDQLNRRKKQGFVGAEISRINSIPAKATPPTYFRVNDFTAPFQEIVDTYGIPRYREVNPGLFTIGMFPFLFGVMFGDIGHGSILFVVGLYLLYKYEDLKKIQDLKDILDLRYLITLMGFFATYAGFIYNDFFSIPFNLFGSCYENNHETNEAEKIEDCVYPFGLDPKWYVAKNELNFFNSYKMKLAVIIGVCQMMFGIILKGLNAINFRQPLDFIFEFIPQIIFMTVTFVFMDAMIFIKWGVDWSQDTSQAPSIITQMINLALQAGSVDGKPLWEESSQVSINQTFLMIAGIMVPIMLFPKVLIIYVQHRNDHKKHHIKHHKSELNQPLVQQNQEESHDDHHDISEVFVHQMIETIEFVLGSISNTASYLRLWALSLAHSQLAKTFFEKCIGGGLEDGNMLVIFIGWFLFTNITFGVLMCMDVMECLLHALRLQWVEFQNKFFKADGYKFQPFSFNKSLSEVTKRQ